MFEISCFALLNTHLLTKFVTCDIIRLFLKGININEREVIDMTYTIINKNQIGEITSTAVI